LAYCLLSLLLLSSAGRSLVEQRVYVRSARRPARCFTGHVANRQQ
jgi:hypothetical protein